MVYTKMGSGVSKLRVAVKAQSERLDALRQAIQVESDRARLAQTQLRETQSYLRDMQASLRESQESLRRAQEQLRATRERLERGKQRHLAVLKEGLASLWQEQEDGPSGQRPGPCAGEASSGYAP